METILALAVVVLVIIHYHPDLADLLVVAAVLVAIGFIAPDWRNMLYNASCFLCAG